ncbi:MAG: beta strand repeat-containing protein [Alphaproteobacteria bacterium]
MAAPPPTDGDDTLPGTGGADTLAGGLGNDTYTVNDAGDVVLENAGEGTDTVLSSITYTLPDNVENLTLSGAGVMTATGNALANILIGSDSSDANTLNGLAGADTMMGGAGGDYYIVDNAGDVVIETADPSQDEVRSTVTFILPENVENLTLLGTDNIDGTGNDVINSLYGNGFNNTLSAGGGNDNIDGGAGDDYIDGGSGEDLMLGGAGDDTYVVDSVSDFASEMPDEGTDTAISSINFSLDGMELENLTLTGAALAGAGNAYNNVISGNALANTLSGGDGDDTLIGGAGADTMTGGAGADRFVVDALDKVLDAGADDVICSSITYTLAAGCGALELTGAAAINGTGNAGDNTLTGNGAVNRLTGGLGNDTYVAGAGDMHSEMSNGGTDTVRAAISWLLGTNIEKLVLTGAGHINGTGNTLVNTLTGNAGDNTLNGGTGADSMAGGAGNDTYIVDNIGDVVTELDNEGTDTVQSKVTYTLGAFIENLVLTATVHGTGNGLDNSITGSTGNNTLNGGGGADQLIGGAGNDSYVIDVADTITEDVAKGTDSVFADFSYVLGVNLENLILTGAGNIDGTGNAAVNSLVGNAGANLLDGLAGADKMNGGLGDDIYIVDNTGDIVTETLNGGMDTVNSSVTLTLKTNVENLNLTGANAVNGTGNALANDIAGNAANNTLNGSGGDDTIVGGGGNDKLTGGTGADTFKFTADSANGTTTISDFSLTQFDVLDFHDFISGYDPVEDAVTDFIEIVVLGRTGFISVDRDGDGGIFAMTPVATITNANMTMSDEGQLLFSGHIVL